MAKDTVHQCTCEICENETAHPVKEIHRHLNLFMSRLDEQKRRWLAGLESMQRGYGGDVAVAQITGLDEKTIRRGRRELEAELKDRPKGRVRLPGAGRPRTEKKHPTSKGTSSKLSPQTLPVTRSMGDAGSDAV